MLRIICRMGFVCLALGALATGATVLGVLGSSDLQADERGRARLLVKCEREEVAAVLAALAQTKAEVWDLATMKRVQAAPPPAEAQPTPKQPVVVPPLRDAGKVMEEMLAAVASVKPGAGAASPTASEMSIQERRATLKVSAATHADIHAVAKALEASPWLRARLKQLDHGAVQRTTGGRFQGSLSIRFDESRPEPGVLTPLTQLDMQVIEQAVRAVKMQYVRAGAVASDPDRKAGFVTTWRDFTFQTAKLTSLRALILTLAKAHPGLVVFEVRYKDNGSGYALDPALRLGGRAPLGR